MKPAPFKRWYERQPRLAQAVKLTVLLPEEVQSIVADALLLIANREYKASMMEKSFKTVGSEKIMGIHKSKNKRREYDQNETLHRAMNHLYILSEASQDEMAEHILSMIGYIKQYFGACQEFQAASSLEDVANITHKYVHWGNAGAEALLKKLRHEFYSTLLNPGKSSNNMPASASEEIREDVLDSIPVEKSLAARDHRQGMRIEKLNM